MNQNLIAFENTPIIKDTGFREYDARWILGSEINLVGIQALGVGLGTYIHQQGHKRIVVGHDYRSYSLSVKQSLILGLIQAGCEVLDIGLSVTPMAYFAQFDLCAPCVAMVTASHNENGWTGVKMGINPPLTFGPYDMQALKTIVLNGNMAYKSGGSVTLVTGIAERYIAEVSNKWILSKPLTVICACGNGTAGAFAPNALRRMGAKVIELDCELNWNFPNYNPNPEDKLMLHAMSLAVKEHGADLALGFDGDGDRCGIVDDEGNEIFADKMGLLLARELVTEYPNSTFIVDVKSTGLFATDEVLASHGANTIYWKTGHSYIKSKTAEINALAGFEKSGHFFLNGPLGRGYDCALTSAAAIFRLLDKSNIKLSQLRNTIPITYSSPTMSPHCDDEIKYEVLKEIMSDYQHMANNGDSILGRKIINVLTINGIRVTLEDGSWILVRASSNKPELVVVVESTLSHEDMCNLFYFEVKPRLSLWPVIGDYNQEVS